MKYYKYYPFHLIYLLIKKVKNIFYPEKDVNRFIRISLCSLIFLVSLNSFSQQPVVKKTVLDTLVTVNKDSYSLKECLSLLTEKYAVNFSYINDEIPLQKQIHFKFLDQPLKIVLDTVCRQANIRYFLVGTQIVLKNVEHTTTVVAADSNAIVSVDSAQEITAVDTAYQQSGTRKSDTYQMNKKYKKYFFSVFGKQRMPDSMIVVSSNGTKDTISTKEGTKKYRYVNRIYEYSRFSIGLYGGPGIAYRTLSGDDRFVSERNADEQSIVNYIFGLQATYCIPALNISIRSGLNYITFGEKGTYEETIFVLPPIGGGGGPGPPPSETIIQHAYKNQYSYLMLPIMAGYNLHVNSRWCASIYSGISFAFLLTTKSTYTETVNGSLVPGYNQNRNPFLHSYTDVNFVLPIQFEVSYQLRPQIQLFAAPMFNYFLTSIYSKSDWNTEKPYAFNFSVGINYFFQRKK